MAERRSSPALTLAAGLLLLLPSASRAQELAWRVERGEVRVACPLTVGGSFEARSTALSGRLAVSASHPLLLAGSLVLDLKTLDTGIGLRNEHMQSTYLEVARGDGFDTAVLSDLRLGDVDPASFEGRTPFSGTLRLHGTQQPVSGQAEVRREGSSVRIEASFPVSVAAYGIATPQYLGVGVRDEVKVKVSLVAAPAAGEESR